MIHINFCVLHFGQIIKTCEHFSFFPKARTFGHHLLKRLTFAIIPTAFIIGVIMTLLAALTVVSIKGLGVGVNILISIQRLKSCEIHEN